MSSDPDRNKAAAKDRGWQGVPESRRAVMRANRRRDTGPELALRSRLHQQGLRFRVDFPIRIPGRRPVRPDVVFTRKRVAVFVDGCFWHGCPEHATRPKTNIGYWVPKLAENIARDKRTRQALEALGWTVVRIWEHESPDLAVSTVIHALEDQEQSAQ